jgi:hypothetical protein
VRHGQCEQGQNRQSHDEAAPPEENHQAREPRDQREIECSRRRSQLPALQNRFRRERLKHGARDDPAARSAEAIAKLDGGAADQDPLVAQAGEGGCVADNHVRIGDNRYRFGPDAEVDMEGRLLPLRAARKHRGHGQLELAVEQVAIWISPHDAVAVRSDIDQRRPAGVAQDRDRAIDVNAVVSAFANPLFEDGEDDRAAGTAQRFGKCPVGNLVRPRAEVDVEGDLARACRSKR